MNTNIGYVKFKMSNKELKYFYEKLLKASGVPKHHFGMKKYIRIDKIKRIFDL
jgi:hypothetical protein